MVEDAPIVAPVAVAPAPVAVAPVAAPPAPKEPETFSREYVAELRGENKGLRLKATEQEQLRAAAVEEAKAAKAASDAAIAAANAAADQKAADAQTAANDRVIRAELRTVAQAAGMVDLDGLKLADLSTVKLNDAGEVEGADALMTALKEAKPYLFKAATGTSLPGDPPKPAPIGDKVVKDMTPAEYAAARKAATKR